MSNTATASRGHVRHIEPAAIAVHGERHRLGAEVALPRQARIEVALHRKLPAAHIHGRDRVAIGKRHVERLLVRREGERAGMRSRRDGARRLEQRQLACHRAAREIELDDLRSVPQRDEGALSILRDGQGDGIGRRARHRSRRDRIASRLRRSLRRAAPHRQRDFRRPAAFHGRLRPAPQSRPDTARPRRFPLRRADASCAPAASCATGRGISRSGAIFPAVKL